MGQYFWCKGMGLGPFKSARLGDLCMLTYVGKAKFCYAFWVTLPFIHFGVNLILWETTLCSNLGDIPGLGENTQRGLLISVSRPGMFLTRKIVNSLRTWTIRCLSKILRPIYKSLQAASKRTLLG